MGASTTVQIYWSKIEKVIKNTGISQGDMGLSLGHDVSFLTNIKRTERMRKSDVLLFKSLYGVDVERHMISEEDARKLKDESKSVQTINVHIDEEKLGKAIGDSLGLILSNSLSSIIDYDKLTECAYTAMERALSGEDEPPKREKRKLE